VPVLLLLLAGLEVAGLPLAAAVSRRFEREADRIAIELTRDPAAFERVFRRLAAENVSDLDPPLPIRLISTHPTISERLGRVRA
jgi:STE24 endopeptidase